MALCYSGDCGEYAVSPILVRSDSPTRICKDTSSCYPCLPRCPKGDVAVCDRPCKSVIGCVETHSRSPCYHRDYYPDDCYHHDYDCYHGCDHDYRRDYHHGCHHPDRYYHDRYSRRCHSPHSYYRTYPRKCKEYLICDQTPCKPIRTKYVMPCYRYEDGRIVSKLPVTAFKRNGMQDQEHSKLLGTANFLTRCPRDVAVECDVCTKPISVCDPVKVPLCNHKPLGSSMLKKKPVKVSLDDIID